MILTALAQARLGAGAQRLHGRVQCRFGRHRDGERERVYTRPNVSAAQCDQVLDRPAQRRVVRVDRLARRVRLRAGHWLSGALRLLDQGVQSDRGGRLGALQLHRTAAVCVQERDARRRAGHDKH